MVAFVVLGEGGVAGGVVPRGKDDGGTIDGEGGAAMASLYQYTVVRTSRHILKPFSWTFQRDYWATCLDLVRGSRGLLQPGALLCHVPSSLHKAHLDFWWQEHRAMNPADEYDCC